MIGGGAVRFHGRAVLATADQTDHCITAAPLLARASLTRSLCVSCTEQRPSTLHFTGGLRAVPHASARPATQPESGSRQETMPMRTKMPWGCCCEEAACHARRSELWPPAKSGGPGPGRERAQARTVGCRLPVAWGSSRSRTRRAASPWRPSRSRHGSTGTVLVLLEPTARWWPRQAACAKVKSETARSRSLFCGRAAGLGAPAHQALCAPC